MCGLVGVFASVPWQWPTDLPIDLALNTMMSEVAHRGPDGFGQSTDPHVALGHRRLSIIDRSSAGSQPMELAEDGVAIAYNGECYNFLELRATLETLGRRFRTRSDTEVILQCYAQWGLSGLTRLEGVFAIAISDRRNGRLVLMRDRLGVKPLYYRRFAGGLLFASEQGPLARLGPKLLDDDAQAFSEYLWFGSVLGDRTFSTQIRQLPPGHFLIAERERIEVSPWFRLEHWLQEWPVVDSPEAALERTKATIDTAVRRQLVSDVPVGLFLSGGLDSSVIACSASKYNSGMTAITAVLEGATDGNEVPQASLIATTLKLQHRLVPVDFRGLLDVVKRLAKHHYDPFADAANIPLYLMSRQVADDIKVVLQGDGGDEIFAGYRRYRLLRHSHIFRAIPSWMRMVVRRFGRVPGYRMARMLDSLGHSEAAARMALLLTLESPAEAPELLLTSERRAQLLTNSDPFREYRLAAQRFADYDPVQQMLLTDLTIELPSTFLPKVDRATMATGVEARVPLLDERVAEWAVGLDSNIKLGRSKSKWLLRETLSEVLPKSVVDGPKTGFGVPYGKWVDGPLRPAVVERVTDASFLQRYGFDSAAINNLLERRTGEARRSFMIWKLFQLAVRDEVVR